MSVEPNEVYVYGSRSLVELISAGKWKLIMGSHVLPSMPRIRTGTVELRFFQEPQAVMLADLDGLLERREHVLVDPFGLICWNLAHPEYSGECPNGTHWKDASGDYCAITFYEQHGVRIIKIEEVRPPGVWTPEWTLAHYGAGFPVA